MCIRHILFLSKVFVQIVKLEPRFTFYLFLNQFPISSADSFVLIEEYVVGGFGFFFPKQNFGDVFSVNDPDR